MTSTFGFRVLATATLCLLGAALGACSGSTDGVGSGGALTDGDDAGGSASGSGGASGSGSGGSSSSSGSSGTGGGAGDDAGARGDAGPNVARDAGSGGSGDAGGGGSDTDAADDGPSTTSWDLTGWTLQLPIGSTDAPQMINDPNGFTDAYFYVDTDGSLTFMDPPTGVTTKGSEHPRSELAEDATWPGSGTNVMTATVAVPLVPDHVTIGQVFQAPSAPSKPLLELQYFAGGTIKVLLEDTNQGGSSTSPVVGTVTDKAKFDYTVALTNDQISITINGKTTPLTMPSSFVGESFYFKWGDYDQTATAGTQTTTVGTVVKFYAHSVSHS